MHDLTGKVMDHYDNGLSNMRDDITSHQLVL